MPGRPRRTPALTGRRASVDLGAILGAAGVGGGDVMPVEGAPDAPQTGVPLSKQQPYQFQGSKFWDNILRGGAGQRQAMDMSFNYWDAIANARAKEQQMAAQIAKEMQMKQFDAQIKQQADAQTQADSDFAVGSIAEQQRVRDNEMRMLGGQDLLPSPGSVSEAGSKIRRQGLFSKSQSGIAQDDFNTNLYGQRNAAFQMNPTLERDRYSGELASQSAKYAQDAIKAQQDIAAMTMFPDAQRYIRQAEQDEALARSIAAEQALQARKDVPDADTMKRRSERAKDIYSGYEASEKTDVISRQPDFIRRGMEAGLSGTELSNEGQMLSNLRSKYSLPSAIAEGIQGQQMADFYRTNASYLPNKYTVDQRKAEADATQAEKISGIPWYANEGGVMVYNPDDPGWNNFKMTSITPGTTRNVMDIQVKPGGGVDITNQPPQAPKMSPSAGFGGGAPQAAPPAQNVEAELAKLREQVNNNLIDPETFKKRFRELKGYK